MHTIQPCIWFDQEAEEAAQFYVSVFNNSKAGAVVPYGPAAAKASGQPVGSVMMAEFTLEGLDFLALNAGSVFRPNPSISFSVECDSEAEMDRLWKQLSNRTLMDLQEYPFAAKYGWCEDRFGVSWQLIYGSHSRPKLPEGARRQKIVPALLFVKDRFGKAAEAIDFYSKHFPESRTEDLVRDEKTGAVVYSRFTLSGSDLLLMESDLKHDFDFTPGISLIARCETQAEIDALWSALSAEPEAEQCGWLKDRYGVSWQIAHRDWGTLIACSDRERRERLMSAVMEMKKPDLKTLERAAGVSSLAGRGGYSVDPELDLVLERVVDIAPEQLFRAWTLPECLLECFCPKPWKVTDVALELKPGGRFHAVMKGPNTEGHTEENALEGCILEVVPNRRLVFTDALEKDFRPAAKPFITATVLYEPHGTGTRYTTIVRHRSIEDRIRHEQMGFHHGWSVVLDQMVDWIKSHPTKKAG